MTESHMTALRLRAPREPLSRDTVPVPVPGVNQVLIRVRACAVLVP